MSSENGIGSSNPITPPPISPASDPASSAPVKGNSGTHSIAGPVNSPNQLDQLEPSKTPSTELAKRTVDPALKGYQDKEAKILEQAGKASKSQKLNKCLNDIEKAIKDPTYIPEDGAKLVAFIDGEWRRIIPVDLSAMANYNVTELLQGIRSGMLNLKSDLNIKNPEKALKNLMLQLEKVSQEKAQHTGAPQDWQQKWAEAEREPVEFLVEFDSNKYPVKRYEELPEKKQATR